MKSWSKDCQLTHLSLVQIYYPDKATEPPLDVENLKSKKEIEKLKRANIEVIEREPIRKVSKVCHQYLYSDINIVQFLLKLCYNVA